ncbi:MAG: glycosyltransferase family 2 protein [Candidatus Dormibacteria bacterium]
MLNGQRVAVVLPAYNAALTIASTVGELDRTIVDDIIVVDDASTDGTVAAAAALGLDAIQHDRNRGYGGNQKTCYKVALERGADIVIMLHPDYQYSPKLIPAIAAMLCYAPYDMVLGSRILAQNALRGGMPLYKYVANRFLTAVENLLVGAKLSEFHTGLRGYRKSLLCSVPFDLNSDDFVFDNQFILQALLAGGRVGELSCPTHYGHDSSSINFRRSLMYGLGVLLAAAQFRLFKLGLARPAYLSAVVPMQDFAQTPSS